MLGEFKITKKLHKNLGSINPETLKPKKVSQQSESSLISVLTFGKDFMRALCKSFGLQCCVSSD